MTYVNLHSPLDIQATLAGSGRAIDADQALRLAKEIASRGGGLILAR